MKLGICITILLLLLLFLFKHSESSHNFEQKSFTYINAFVVPLILDLVLVHDFNKYIVQ